MLLSSFQPMTYNRLSSVIAVIPIPSFLPFLSSFKSNGYSNLSSVSCYHSHLLLPAASMFLPNQNVLATGLPNILTTVVQSLIQNNPKVIIRGKKVISMRKESELSEPNHKLIIYFCKLVRAAYCITEK